MATSPNAREWIDDLRVLQDQVPATLAAQDDELRVEHGHRVWHATRVSVLSVLLAAVVAACALIAILR
jgi:hypothetical protein